MSHLDCVVHYVALLLSDVRDAEGVEGGVQDVVGGVQDVEGGVQDVEEGVEDVEGGV